MFQVDPGQTYPTFDPTALFAGDMELKARKITLASGLNSSGSPLPVGTLLGEVTNGFSAAVAAKVGNTGNGTLAMNGSTPVLANAQVGVYRVVFSSATAFQVYSPKGDEIGTGVNGAAFATQLKFQTTAGGTAFVAGDEFDITVVESLYSASESAAGGNTGNGSLTLASPAAVNGAQVGAYSVVLTSAAAFQVNDPFGNPVGAGLVGTAFSNQIAFTLAAGGTAFAAGDSFSVSIASLNTFKQSVATAADGSQVPRCVLAETVDTSGGAVTCQGWFTGEFAFEQMTVDASWTVDTLNQALIAAASNLFVRSVGTAA